MSSQNRRLRENWPHQLPQGLGCLTRALAVELEASWPWSQDQCGEHPWWDTPSTGSPHAPKRSSSESSLASSTSLSCLPCSLPNFFRELFLKESFAHTFSSQSLLNASRTVKAGHHYYCNYYCAFHSVLQDCIALADIQAWSLCISRKAAVLSLLNLFYFMLFFGSGGGGGGGSTMGEFLRALEHWVSQQQLFRGLTMPSTQDPKMKPQA